MNDLHSLTFPSTLIRQRNSFSTTLYLRRNVVTRTCHFISFLFDDHLFIYLLNLVHHKSQPPTTHPQKQTINKQSSISKFNLRKLQRLHRGGRSVFSQPWGSFFSLNFSFVFMPCLLHALKWIIFLCFLIP